MRCPDQDLAEIWPQMTDKEKEWYILFHRATRRHDWKALRELCDMPPGANFDKLKKEISYELRARERNTYKIPKKYNSTYTELDYAWSQPRPLTPCKRVHIDYDYFGSTGRPERQNKT